MEQLTVEKLWGLRYKFNAGQEVVCLDESLSVGGLKRGAEYVIDRVSFLGYVWLIGIRAPQSPTRFEAVTRPS